MLSLDQLIEKARAMRASDVHIVCGLPAKCGVDGNVTDLTGEVLTAAACELLGRTAEECVYSELFESVCPFSHVISMQRSEFVESELTVGERSVELYFAPFSDEESGGVLIVLHDVPERRKTEERRKELAKAVKAKAKALKNKAKART